MNFYKLTAWMLLAIKPALGWPSSPTAVHFPDRSLDHNKCLERKIVAMADELTLMVSSKPTTVSSYRLSGRTAPVGAERLTGINKFIESGFDSDPFGEYHFINFWTRHENRWRTGATALPWLAVSLLSGVLPAAICQNSIAGYVGSTVAFVMMFTDLSLAVTGHYGKKSVKRSQKMIRQTFFNRLKENGLPVPLFGKDKWLKSLIASIQTQSCELELTSVRINQADDDAKREADAELEALRESRPAKTLELK